MSRSATILRNVASNWIGFGVNAAVTLVVTPLMLQQLGEARYGIWILTISITGYYGLLDFGFRAGVTQYLTRYIALGDYDQGSDVISSGVVILSLLGVALAALTIIAAFVAPQILDFPPAARSEAVWCIWIVGTTLAVQFPFLPFTSVFAATQRFDLSNAIGVATRLLTAGGVIFALKSDYGLIGVSVATCGASVVDYLIRWQVARRLAPELRFSVRRATVARLREVASFGGWNFLVQINSFVALHVPNILISLFMPVAAVGYYALARGLVRHIDRSLESVASVLYPAATHLYARGDRVGLERLYHDGSRLVLLVTIPMVLVAGIWADEFYRLWVGEKYLSGVPFHSVALILQILLVSIATSYVSSVAAQILVGGGRIRALAITMLCASLLRLILSVLLIGAFGLAGMATSALISTAVVDLVVVPYVLQRAVGLKIRDFLIRACIRPAVAGLLQAIVMLGIRWAGTAETWFALGLQGLIAGGAAMVLGIGFGLTDTERRRFIMGPLRGVWRRVTFVPDVKGA